MGTVIGKAAHQVRNTPHRAMGCSTTDGSCASARPELRSDEDILALLPVRYAVWQSGNQLYHTSLLDSAGHETRAPVINVEQAQATWCR